MSEFKQDQHFLSAASSQTRRGCRFALVTLVLLAALNTGCSIVATRPVQEMSNTQAAIRAANEVQADILAPELFRQANEWFLKARQEYRFKDFANAKKYADQARTLAEQAELLAIRNGGVRGGSGGEDPELREPAPPPPAAADAMPPAQDMNAPATEESAPPPPSSSP